MPDNSNSIHHARIHDCIILGGGASALFAADRLRAKGRRVLVIDKARLVGGRMSTRRLTVPAQAQTGESDAWLDFGAQFFTVRSPRFQAYVDRWLAEGEAAVWFEGSGGHPRYRGIPNMKSLLLRMAEPLAADDSLLLQTRITRIARSESGGGWNVFADGDAGSRHIASARSLILTPPVPQTIDLLTASELLDQAERDALSAYQYHPCFALMLIYAADDAPQIPAGYLTDANDGDRPALGPHIRWLADNQAKGVSPDHIALTVHTEAEFTRTHYEHDPEAVRDALIESAPVLRGHQPVAWQLHRWRYSVPAHAASERSPAGGNAVPANPPHPESGEPSHCRPLAGHSDIILAGDGLSGGRVEGAVLSGLDAADWVEREIAASQI
mgnify:CR=1 FL=1